jgi:DNA-binding CsgD family transcriptional regulator
MSFAALDGLEHPATGVGSCLCGRQALIFGIGEDALDSFSLGVLIVTADARVHTANRLAEEILTKNDGLGVEGGRLRAVTPALTERLASIIREAADAAVARATHPGGLLGLPRRRMTGSPLALLIRPWRASSIQLGMSGPAALIFIEDPSRANRVDAGRLAELYCLTEAETRLLMALLDGQRINDYAASAGITAATARSHLSSLFAKTGQRRQADLVRMALSSGIARIGRIDRNGYQTARDLDGPGS